MFVVQYQAEKNMPKKTCGTLRPPESRIEIYIYFLKHKGEENCNAKQLLKHFKEHQRRRVQAWSLELL